MLRALSSFALAAATVLSLSWGPTAQAAEFTLNMGSLAPDGTPWMQALKDIEKEIETNSGGRIEVNIYPPGVLSETEMVRETRQGQRLQGCGVTTAAIAEAGNVPQLQLVELPYLFANSEQADRILDTVVYDDFTNLLSRRGFVFGAWSENGWRSFATRGGAVKTPTDLKQYKMRAQESDVHMKMYEAFGAQAVQKPMTEVLTALNSNVIDGLDNTPLYIQAGGLASAINHFSETRHIYQPAAIIFSKRWFDSLPEDLQKIVIGNPKQRAVDGRKLIRDEETALMSLFPEVFNVQVHALSDAEREAFATIVRPIHGPFADTVDGGPELLKKIKDAL